MLLTSHTIQGPMRQVRKLLFELAGSMLLAIGWDCFAIPAQFPMVGFSGIAILLNRLLGAPVGLAQFVLNIPLAILCWRLLGREFLLHSVFCIVASSVLTDYVAVFLPVYTGERMLAALATGVLCGAGYALIFLQNASTGGTDFIVMALRTRWPHKSVGSLTMLCSIVIIAASECFFPDIDGAIYVLVLEFLTAKLIDRALFGLNAGKMTMIVTDRSKAVCDAIAQTVDRGCTIFPARGAYRGEPREVVMCACASKEMYLVEHAVRQADPQAFIIVLDSTEVHGEGFHPLILGKTTESEPE